MFISYRRSDSTALARLFYDKLMANGFAPFFDKVCLVGGQFNHQLFDTIDRTPVFMPILSRGYLMRERIREENDFVVLEMTRALNAGSRFVPLIAEGYIGRVYADVQHLPHADVRNAICMAQGTPISDVRRLFCDASLLLLRRACARAYVCVCVHVCVHVCVFVCVYVCVYVCTLSLNHSFTHSLTHSLTVSGLHEGHRGEACDEHQHRVPQSALGDPRLLSHSDRGRVCQQLAEH